MANFFEKKRNQVILGVIVGIIFVGAAILVLTGKINLRSIMGNTAQGSYTCPEGQGYTLNQSTKKCEKTVTYEATKSCPSGYESYTGGTCIKYVEVNMSCPTGYESYTGDTCRKKIDTTTCPSGYESYTGGTCRKLVYTTTCPSGYESYTGGTCRKFTGYTTSCPTGYESYTGGICRKKTGYTVICPKGYNESTIYGTCKNSKYPYDKVKGTIKEKYTTAAVEKKANYDIVSETKTSKYDTVSEIKTTKYDIVGASCPSNTVKQSNGKCKGQDIKGEVYSCPNGGSLSGTNCVKIESIDATFIENKEETTSTVKTEKINISSARSDWSTATDFTSSKNGIIVSSDPGTNEVTMNCNSSNESVAKLTQTKYTFKGSTQLKITGVGVGTTTITCTTTDNKSTSYQLKLCSPDNFGASGCSTGTTTSTVKTEKINISSARSDWSTATDFTSSKNGITVSSDPGTNEVTMNCKSSNESVAKLTQTKYTFKGSTQLKITGVGVGTTTITCTTTDNKSASYQLKLCSPDNFGASGCSTGTTTNNKQEVTTKTCPTGYTKSGNICTKTETIAATIKYSCANGYTLNGSKCQKIETKEPTSTFTCPTGYSKSGNSCYRIDSKTATITYSCTAGYTYNKDSKKCEKQSTVNVVSNGYTCPEGYDLIEGTNECIKVTNVDNLASCPYIYLDGKCLKIDYQNASTLNSCPTGYTLNNGTCLGITSVSAIKNYKCSTGYTLNGKTCTKKITKTVNTNKYCATGYKLVNNKCQKTITVSAKASYSCKEGYTINGTTCTRTITTELK